MDRLVRNLNSLQPGLLRPVRRLSGQVSGVIQVRRQPVRQAARIAQQKIRAIVEIERKK